MNQFKRCVGLSAFEYISQYRINYACKKIADTPENIADIAFDSGFRNLSNFNRQFLKTVGCTPLAYRKKHQAKNTDYLILPCLYFALFSYILLSAVSRHSIKLVLLFSRYETPYEILTFFRFIEK